MLIIAIIFSSLAVLVLLLYLGEFKFELRLNKSTKLNTLGEKKTLLDNLSSSELNILRLVSMGKTNQEIADELFISVHTVKKHISNIFRKLNLKSRAETRKFKDLINNNK